MVFFIGFKIPLVVHVYVNKSDMNNCIAFLCVVFMSELVIVA